jgi:hypothetical protein
MSHDDGASVARRRGPRRGQPPGSRVRRISTSVASSRNCFVTTRTISAGCFSPLWSGRLADAVVRAGPWSRSSVRPATSVRSKSRCSISARGRGCKKSHLGTESPVDCGLGWLPSFRRVKDGLFTVRVNSGESASRESRQNHLRVLDLSL